MTGRAYRLFVGMRVLMPAAAGCDLHIRLGG